MPPQLVGTERVGRKPHTSDLGYPTCECAECALSYELELAAIAAVKERPANVSAKSLIAWRERHGFNKVEACKQLGIARGSLDAYESGLRPIPLTVALACQAISNGLPPMR